MRKKNLLFLFIFFTNISFSQHIGTGSMSNHTIIAKAYGTVYTWGFNDVGQLGNGNNNYANSNVPVAVNTSGVLSGKTITQVGAGERHSIALASDGTVYTWGNNDYGQLGNGNNIQSNVPVAVNTSGVLSGKTITQIGAGQYHSIALASDGTVYTWGYNNYGQLGNGDNTDSNVPVAVTTSGVLSGKTITKVAGGANHSIALASDGTVYTWGFNEVGQLGNGDYTDSNVPVAVSTSGVLSGKTITQVAAGEVHSIALASDGTVYTWGYNYYGQLGNGNNTNSNVPVAVTTSGALSGKTITQVACGGNYSIALASDGTVYTWGFNHYGQLGNGTNGTGTDSNVPVAVSTSVMGSLPVEWHSFTAKKQNNNVLLEWSTASEQNTKDFIVQHSSNGSEYKNIGNVTAAGNSSTIKYYNCLHTTPIKSNNYYRILQRDLDGKSSYSEVRMVKLQPTIDKFKITGNPIINGQLQITILSACTLKLYSSDGTILWSKKFAAGSQTVDMSKYAKGIYLLKAEGQSEQIVVQ